MSKVAEIAVSVACDAFGVQDVETGVPPGHIHALTAVGHRQRVQHVVLTVLEVTPAPGEVLKLTEVGEPAVAEQARGIRAFVDRRPAHVLETEAGEDIGPFEHLAGVLVGHAEDDGVGDAEPGIIRIQIGRAHV